MPVRGFLSDLSVAAIIAMAANTEGRREIVGLGIGPSETKTFWADFLNVGAVLMEQNDNCHRASLF
jgi:transposase-like protein